MAKVDEENPIQQPQNPQYPHGPSRIKSSMKSGSE
ncbi:unnamed protein product [Rhodiola kirilowii]